MSETFPSFLPPQEPSDIPIEDLEAEAQKLLNEIESSEDDLADELSKLKKDITVHRPIVDSLDETDMMIARRERDIEKDKTKYRELTDQIARAKEPPTLH